ncbi:hypothetical protein SLEP1_g21965 [Rubroshorea leprosula]|uniref:Disease resistance protein winged helix domain-containing protein n=1 Tax=Rubroshorea leprosula TaxID=152421 RepID=A0AAV5JF09_9ROSI|nr:hypothetical protein SLEP1_g21965 [Rubroshorea leprosula]
MRLKRLWIAEGLVEVKEGKKPEDVAEDYLNELLNRSLIQVAAKTSDGRVKTCRIHDLLREIVISKSRDQNFAVVAKEQDAPWPEKMSILRCKSLEKVPLGIEHLSMLKALEFFEMEELINTLRPGVDGGDYCRVKRIPEVYFTYCRNGEWEVYSLESSGEMVPGEPRDIVQK